MSNYIYEVFGHLWKFNLSGERKVLHRWIILPTVSVYCLNYIKCGFNMRYWNIDFMWLRSIATLEIEQLKLKD